MSDKTTERQAKPIPCGHCNAADGVIETEGYATRLCADCAARNIGRSANKAPADVYVRMPVATLQAFYAIARADGQERAELRLADAWGLLRAEESAMADGYEHEYRRGYGAA